MAKDAKKDLTRITGEERRAIAREVRKVSKAARIAKDNAAKVAAKVAKAAAKAAKSTSSASKGTSGKTKLKIKIKISKNVYIAGVIFLALLALFFIIQNLSTNILPFIGNQNVMNMTDAQLRSAIGNSLSSSSKITIYPSSHSVEIKQGETGGVGLGIKNVMPESKSFSYVVSVVDYSNCTVVTKELISTWFAAGKSNNNVTIGSGNFSSQRVLLKMPLKAPICTMKFNADVQFFGTEYASDSFDVKVLPQSS